MAMKYGMYGYRDPFNRKCFQWKSIDDELLQFFVKIGKIHKKLSNKDKTEDIIQQEKDLRERCLLL